MRIVSSRYCRMVRPLPVQTNLRRKCFGTTLFQPWASYYTFRYRCRLKKLRQTHRRVLCNMFKQRYVEALYSHKYCKKYLFGVQERCGLEFFFAFGVLPMEVGKTSCKTHLKLPFKAVFELQGWCHKEAIRPTWKRPYGFSFPTESAQYRCGNCLAVLRLLKGFCWIWGKREH